MAESPKLLHSSAMDLWTRLWSRYHVSQNVFLVTNCTQYCLLGCCLLYSYAFTNLSCVDFGIKSVNKFISCNVENNKSGLCACVFQTSGHLVSLSIDTRRRWQTLAVATACHVLLKLEHIQTSQCTIIIIIIQGVSKNVYSVSKHSSIYTQKFISIFYNLTKILREVVLHVKMQKFTVFGQLRAALKTFNWRCAELVSYSVLWLSLDVFSTSEYPSL